MAGFETLTFDIRKTMGRANAPRRNFSVFHDDFGSGISVNAKPSEIPEAVPVEEERMFSRSEFDAAVEKARLDGMEAGRTEGMASGRLSAEQAVALSVGRIAALLGGAEETVRRSVIETSEDIAKILFAALKAMLPELMQRHGAEEIAAMAHAIVPRVADGIKPRILVNTNLAADVERCLTHPGKTAPMIEVVPNDDVPPGDAILEWKSGNARLNCSELWKDIMLTLTPLSFVNEDAGDENVG